MRKTWRKKAHKIRLNRRGLGNSVPASQILRRMTGKTSSCSPVESVAITDDDIISELGGVMESALSERDVQLTSEQYSALARAIKSLERERAHFNEIRRELEDTNKKLTLLSWITCHDILNQLTVINGYIYLMNENPKTDEEPKKYLQKMGLAAENIRQLIGFSRDYRMIGKTESQWQDLKKVIIQGLVTIDKGKVTITVETGSVCVYADLLLEKVFFNLADNAIRHGEKITQLSFSCHETDKGLVIVCEDDGIGIPEKEKEHIFYRKYSRHLCHGLSLCKDILAVTGLSIRETGKSGMGTRFEIDVPKGLYKILPDCGSDNPDTR